MARVLNTLLRSLFPDNYNHRKIILNKNRPSAGATCAPKVPHTSDTVGLYQIEGWRQTIPTAVNSLLVRRDLNRAFKALAATTENVNPKRLNFDISQANSRA